MDCPRPIKSVLPRFYPTWSSRTRPALHGNTKVRGPGVEARRHYSWQEVQRKKWDNNVRYKMAA